VITELKSPTNIKELQSTLGMINYLRAFTTNMSEIVGPMRELLRKDSMWVWSKECEVAFNSLKVILAQVPTLANYDYKDSFEIRSDASQKAIGCCLFQKGIPVYYASRCLSSTLLYNATVRLVSRNRLTISKSYRKIRVLPVLLKHWRA